MIKRLLALSTRIRILVNKRLSVPAGLCHYRLCHYRLPPVLPELCVTCLTHPATEGLCSGCRTDLPRNSSCCHRCGLPLMLATPCRNLICGECLKHPPPFDYAFMPWRYQFPVDRMISRYKYQKQRSFARPLLAGMVGEVSLWLGQAPECRPQLLIPAPMHRRRERQRGFNQAADIAEAISAGTGVPWAPELVVRVRKASAQSGLDRKQRLKNLKGVFRITGAVPRHVAIVDDVVTTGATARTLAALLRSHGAETVQIWALARTPAQPGSGQVFPHMAGDGEAGRQAR